MMKCIAGIVCLLLIIATLHCPTANAGRTSGRSVSSGRRSGGYYGSQNPQQPVTDPPSPQTAKEYLDNKSGFSTFGIISIIFAAILVCLIFYYGIVCYPFICKDDKKYRFMDVSSTITAATSRSIQSIENFPVDQKH